MTKTVVVDDDPIARLSLKSLLKQLAPDFEISGEASTLSEAVALTKQFQPDTVFLDIHLPDGSGLDLVASLPKTANIVFISVSNEHAFRAFEVNALDYLQKPVEPARLAETLRRLRQREQPSQPAAPIENSDLVYLSHDAGQIFVPASAILLIESQRNYTRVFTTDKRKFTVRRSIAAWETLLAPAGFFRLNRTQLIRTGAIEHMEESKEGELIVTLSHWSRPLVASRRQAKALTELVKSSVVMKG